MTLKVLLTSDWHADKSSAGFDRFEDVREAAIQTALAAVDEDVDLWAFLGDLTDPEDGPRALRALELAVEVDGLMPNRARGLRKKVPQRVWLAGNHDVIEDGSGRTTLSPLRRLAVPGIMSVSETPGCFEMGDVAVVCLPYPSVSRPFDLEDYARSMIKDYVARGVRTGLVLAHATYIPGVVEGEETLEMPRGRAVPLPVDVIPKGWTIANGHFHTPQVTPGGVIVPGALARLTFGEQDNEPRFVILEV